MKDNHIKAKFYKKEKDNSVKCLLCPHYCLINEGKIGYCNVRKNIGGELYTLSYGHPIALNMDPIEKKPMYHFYPGTRILSIGTYGCNLGCLFCQNYDISRGKYDEFNLGTFIEPDEIIQAALRYDSIGIAYTYNEPTVFAEYVMDISKIARERGLKNVMVTNGYISEKTIEEVYRFIDAANVDLKSIDPEFYRKYVIGELEPVLVGLKSLKNMGVWIEVTNLIIPGLNDSENNIKDLVGWILENLGDQVPLHFSAFHPTYKMTNRPRTSKDILDKAREIALKMGMKYVYEGNVLTTTEGNTYCPNCGELLIQRSYFDVIRNKIKNGICPKCGKKINVIY